MSRQDMINELISHEIEVNLSDPSMCKEMLLSGWVGYDNMSLTEITSEWEAIQ